MGRAEERNKSARSAAELIKRGFPHGKRWTRPMPNSGGQTMVNRPGSAKNHRLMDKKAQSEAERIAAKNRAAERR